MRNHLTFGLVAALFAAPATYAQMAEAQPALPSHGELLAQWRAKHGDNWRLHVSSETGWLEMLSGGHTQAAFRPVDDLEFVQLAQAALRETEAWHGMDASTLRLERALHLPLGMTGSTDKMTVRFRQVVNGVPVEFGWANVLLDMKGGVLSIQTTGAPRVAGLNTTPAVAATGAVETAVAYFGAETGLEPTHIGQAELVVDQHLTDDGRKARLAWKVNVQAEHEGFTPEGKNVYVDARTGVAYRTTESIHFFDVSGTVTSNASPGLLPDIATNPEQQFPMKYARVTAGAVTATTDANGNFTLVGVNAPVSATFTYVGTYNNSLNAAGAEYSLVQTLNNATGNVVAMNPAPTEAVTAQANAFRQVNILRDFVRATNPSDATADFVATANVQVAGSCNAFYNGSSTNYYPLGGGCNNTAFSTVINHEHGHWMNDRYGTGNGADGMGEGNADVFAMYIQDTPVVGQNFTTTGGIVRTGQNTRQFCGDANPGCYGEVHNDGEPWMGAAWKIRARLNTSLGNTAGDLTSNALFMGWMNGYNQGQIRSLIETQWLTLDDDDGNINNGTPHYTDIDNGFKDQGFPGVQLFAISYTNVSNLPDTQNQVGPYVVTANISANQAPSLASVQLFWRVGSGAFNSLPMSLVSGTQWRGEIPGIVSPATCEYYLRAQDSLANVATFPSTAPTSVLDFDIGIVRILGSWTFDAPSDEGWTHGATAGTDEWQRETPAGRTGTGWADPGNAFSPSNAWGNDMGNGTTTGTANGAYSANSNTWLRTPIMNATGASGVKLYFKRWLTVQGSASDQARIRVNGTQVYLNPTANFADTSWTSQVLDISALADNNPALQIEWNLQTNGTTNWGGWNIDDVVVKWIEALPPPCPTPTNYCIAAPNSVGPGAHMSWQGTGNISVNNLELIAVGCPANAAGIFFFGSGQAQAPFGNGYRCVSGSIYRYSPTNADFLGDAHQIVNLQSGSPTTFVAGQTWNFQFWYRNAAAGGAGFNLSDGLQVTICP